MNSNWSQNPPNYPSSLKNNFNPQNQPTQQPQYTSNTLNLPHNYLTPTPTYSPTDNNSLNRNKIDRAMYSSTIQNTLPHKTFNTGKLELMGRFVPNLQQQNNHNNKPTFQFRKSPQQQNYQKQTYQNQPLKQYQPQNTNNKIGDFDRFPSFNLQQNHLPNQVNKNHFQPQSAHQPDNLKNTNETLTPQEKRRKQILAIKQQLDLINQKMQSSNLSKKYPSQRQKNEQTSQSFMQTNNLQTPTNNYTNNQTNFTNIRNYNETPSTGLSFNRNVNQLQAPQRSKGMVAQSMIVSTQPSPGYKYQSIFDKYDSLKKPVYQTTNTTTQVKEFKPSFLQSLANKGMNNVTDKQFNEANSKNTSNVISPRSMENKAEKQKSNYVFSKPKQQFNNNTNLNFASSSSSSSNSSSSSTSSFSSTSSTSPLTQSQQNEGFNKVTFNTEAPKQGQGMFKKKKVNIVEQIKIQTIINQTQADQNNHTHNKFTKNIYQQNLVTKKMKQMKIQESVQFKRQDFAIGKKLGKGQFGEVMLVQHKNTGFLCGMKVMEKKQIRDQKYQGQIARQLSIQFYLAHRNIAPLYGYFQDQKNVYLLVQYCTGGQLLEMLRKNRRMEEPEVSRVIRQIIEGIDYIHKELIIHRDIKPENILFNFGVAKICDYGWAVYKGHGMRKTASVGSPLYYSPEIVMGVEYDEKIDIWDIGMMTYECLLGKIPFRIYSELDLNRIVQDEIKFPEYIETTDEAKDFILKIMKKKPEERMQIREMLRHPFITKYPEPKLPIQIMKDFKEALS